MSLLQIIVLCIVFLTAAIQLIFYIGFYLRAVKLKTYLRQNKNISVSIIVAARNEVVNLENVLPVILHQQYNDYEVIIVDDRSSDGTELLIKRFQKSFKNLKYIRINEKDSEFLGKKYALSRGIEQAKNDALLFTDADCLPASDMWISRMVQQYPENNGIVLGYGAYFKERTFLNMLIRYDTAFIAMQYGGFALAKFPYMGVGRNMMYSKKLWEQRKGFDEHIHIASGDDDLFVQQHYKSAHFEVQFHQEAVTRSFPKHTFKQWCAQKNRHFSTSGMYPIQIKSLILLEPISRVLFYLCFVVGVIISTNVLIYVLLVVFIVRFIVISLVFGLFCKRVSEKGLLKYLPLLDLIMPLVQTYFYLCGNNRLRNNTWK
jgi:glycosyltransferase involved in cell wall biosynthesis